MADEPLPIIDRTPEWRMVWDELDKPLQKEIWRTIRRGEAMSDPGRAAVTAAAAIRWQRQLLIQAVLFFVVGAVMAIGLWKIKPADPNFFYWMQTIIAAAWLFVGVPMALFWRRRASAAEAANREVVKHAAPPDARSEEEQP